GRAGGGDRSGTVRIYDWDGRSWDRGGRGRDRPGKSPGWPPGVKPGEVWLASAQSRKQPDRRLCHGERLTEFHGGALRGRSAQQRRDRAGGGAGPILEAVRMATDRFWELSPCGP